MKKIFIPISYLSPYLPSYTAPTVGQATRVRVLLLNFIENSHLCGFYQLPRQTRIDPVGIFLDNFFQF